MKKLVLVACAGLMAAFANASELWWTLDTSATVDGEGWDSAALFATTEGFNYGGIQVGSKISNEKMDDLGYVATELGAKGSSTYSFYIELYNSSGDRLGASYVSLGGAETRPQGATAYNSLSASLYTPGMSTVDVSPYAGFTNFTSANVIPEPTSGLMILLGLAALGLKRKHA